VTKQARRRGEGRSKIRNTRRMSTAKGWKEEKSWKMKGEKREKTHHFLFGDFVYSMILSCPRM
jgi:hypothetical protein